MSNFYTLYSVNFSNTTSLSVGPTTLIRCIRGEFDTIAPSAQHLFYTVIHFLLLLSVRYFCLSVWVLLALIISGEDAHCMSLLLEMNTQGSAVHIVIVDRIQPVVVAQWGYLSKFLLGMCRLSVLLSQFQRSHLLLMHLPYKAF